MARPALPPAKLLAVVAPVSIVGVGAYIAATRSGQSGELSANTSGPPPVCTSSAAYRSEKKSTTLVCCVSVERRKPAARSQMVGVSASLPL